mgnify:CR=1 FL=1|jgi:hypothetical protein
MPSFDDVLKLEKYKNDTPEQQKRVRDLYFKKHIAPKVQAKGDDPVRIRNLFERKYAKMQSPGGSVLEGTRKAIGNVINDVDRTGIKSFKFRAGYSNRDTLEEKIAYLKEKVGEKGYVTTNRHNDRSPDFAITQSGLEKLNLGKAFKGKPVSIEDDKFTRYDLADMAQEAPSVAAALTAGMFTGGLGVFPAMGVMGAAGGGTRAIQEGIEQLQGKNLQSLGGVAGDVARTAALEAGGEVAGRTIMAPFRYMMGPNTKRAGSMTGERAPSETIVDPAHQQSAKAARELGIQPNVNEATGRNTIAGYAQRLAHTLGGGNPAGARNLQALTRERGKIFQDAMGGGLAKDRPKMGALGGDIAQQVSKRVNEMEKRFISQDGQVKKEVANIFYNLRKSFGKGDATDVGDRILGTKAKWSDGAKSKYEEVNKLLKGNPIGEKVVDMTSYKALAAETLKGMSKHKHVNDEVVRFLKGALEQPDSMTLMQGLDLSKSLGRNAWTPNLLAQLDVGLAKRFKDTLDKSVDDVGKVFKDLETGYWASTQKQVKAKKAYDDAKDYYSGKGKYEGEGIQQFDNAMVLNLGKKAKTGELSTTDIIKAIDGADASSTSKLFKVLNEDQISNVRRMYLENTMKGTGVANGILDIGKTTSDEALKKITFHPKAWLNGMDSEKMTAVFGKKKAKEIIGYAEDMDKYGLGDATFSTTGPLAQSMRQALKETQSRKLATKNKFIEILQRGPEAGSRFEDAVDLMIKPTGESIAYIKQAREILDEKTFNALRGKSMFKLMDGLVKPGSDPIDRIVDGQALLSVVGKIKAGNANPIVEMFGGGKAGQDMWQRYQRLAVAANQVTQKGSSGLVAANVALHPIKKMPKLVQMNIIGRLMASPKYIDWMIEGFKAPNLRAIGTGATELHMQTGASIINSLMQETNLE